MRFKNWDKKIRNIPPEKSFPVAEFQWKDGSRDSYLRLFTRHLEIDRLRENHVHELKGLQSVQLVKGHYLGFIWAGGILSCLSMVALFTYYDHPLLMISLFFVGIMLIYIGGMGGPAIQINEIKNRTLVLLKKRPPQFNDFLKVFYALKNQGFDQAEGLWLTLDDEEIEELNNQGIIHLNGQRKLELNPGFSLQHRVLIDWPVSDVMISLEGNKLDIAVKDFKLRKMQIKQWVSPAAS
ncbi:hypothetical protein [Marinigracilibium pacificum]|uniref:Uncharacterized protein n=1 Tax=Marinigracilibium pacificum TaxID=2729599 RepID=A0A848IWY4_9BACT|nr:hypothetical protein [Marinigracilibium pacificum]NMM49043.1 hypothetical protein [Marinigracilibium pacificum]